jgi:hypothetical protein
MKIGGEYHADGYARIEGLITPAVARELLSLVKASLDEVSLSANDHMRDAPVLRRPTLAAYGPHYRALTGFHWGLTPTMAALTNCELVPTNSYFRVYQEGDVCLVHSDREACEHSLSLTLGYSDGKLWALDIAHRRLQGVEPTATDFGGEAYTPLSMNVGDAVLYQGVRYRHGRVIPNPNRWSAHLFLHWVDANGLYSGEAFARAPNREPVDFTLS